MQRIYGFFREKKVLVWGLFSVLFGVIAMLFAIQMESRGPADSRPNMLPQFLGHLGIAFLLLGIVGIILEFPNWRVYFEDRLQNIILRKEFLRTLAIDEQNLLLKEVFLAIYKVDNLDRKSFLDFFTTKIQDFIGSPFRDDTTIEINVDRPRSDGSFLAEIDQSYTCRKIPAEGAVLQKEIKYFVDKEDLSGPFEAYKIILQLPEEKPKTFTIPEDFKILLSGTRIILDSAESDPEKKAKVEKLIKANPKGYGFLLSLEPFQTLECLDVQIYVKVSLKLERFVGWEMTHPSLGLKAMFHYPPDDFRIQVENFGMDEARLNPINRPGTYSLKYDSWLLPTTGLAFRFIQLNPNVAEAFDRWSAELAAERSVLPHRG